jgi:hypothetical protein
LLRSEEASKNSADAQKIAEILELLNTLKKKKDDEITKRIDCLIANAKVKSTAVVAAQKQRKIKLAIVEDGE